MKLPAKLTILTASGAAGFSLVLLALRVWPPARPALQAAAASADAAVTAGRGGKVETAASGAATGRHPGLDPGLAARLRAALIFMGIDPGWAEELAAADASGFPGLLERIKAVPESQRSRVMELLLGRWVMLDPEGGAAFFKEHDDGNLEEFLDQWQRVDFPAAAAMAEACGGSVLTDTLIDKAVSDPQGLLAWLRSRPNLNPVSLFRTLFGTGETLDALRSLLKADPDQMLIWSRALPADQWAGGLAGAFAEDLAARHVDEAIAWAESLTQPDDASEAQAAVAATLAASQPERALALLADLPNGGNSSDLCDRVIARLDLRDTDKMLALARALPQEALRSQLMKATVFSLLEKDPARAFAVLEAGELEAGPQSSSAVPSGVKTPEGARRVLEAAENAKATSCRETVVKEALLGWMEKDPPGLADYLRGKMDRPLLASMKENLQAGLAIQTLNTGAADPALMDLIGLPPEALVKVQLKLDPAKAAAALDTVENPAARAQLAGDIASGMNPPDAAIWSVVLKNGAEQAAAWKVIAEEWVLQNSIKTSAWISTLPAGAARDGAVLAMTDQVRKTDPDLAWKWALSMTDPPLRLEALTSTATTWNRRDPAALRQALDAGNFTAAERERLLSNGAPVGAGD